MSVKQNIIDGLNTFESARLKTSGKKRNSDRILNEIYLWQEVSSIADDRLKKAWEKGQEFGGLIPPDALLREMGKGEHIVAESTSMSCVVKVDAPRSNFSKDDFIAAIAKKYKIKLTELQALAEVCKKETAPPLKKRVLEASS